MTSYPVEGAAQDYLLRRLYTPELIDSEELRHVEPPVGDGFALRHVAGLSFRTDWPAVCFPCRTMSGALAGVHLARSDGEKGYEWRPSGARWLPICYADPEDWQRIYHGGELVLVEGVFDRVAVKRACPDLPVLARLSKSVTAIERVLRRYGKRVWVAFDMDEPGEKGARRVTWAMKDHDPKVRVIRVPLDRKDPAAHAEDLGLEHLGKRFEKLRRRTL